MQSWLVKLYVVLGLVGVGFFGWYTFSGREMGSPKRQFIPADVRAQARSSPTRYRSFHFWHVGYGGYRGGK